MPTSTPSSRAAFAAIAISVASLALLQNLVIPVIPLIASDFGVTADAASWTNTAWLIAAAVATPLLGRIGDLRGRRNTFLVVIGVVALGDIIASFAANLPVLILARVLQGVGGALFPLAFGLLRDVMPRERLTGAIGATSAIIGIGGAAGSVLAGPLAALLGWHGIFAVPFIAAVAGIVLTVTLVPRSGARAEGRVNALSALLLSGWLIALLVPLSSGARWGWTSPATLGLFAAAVILMAAWVVSELRSDSPLVDLRLMAARAIWPVNAAALLIGVAAFGFWGYLPQFLETPVSSGWGLGLTVQAAGIALLPLLVGMSAVGFAAGAIARVVPLRVMMALGALLMAGGVVLAVAEHTALITIAIAGGVFGLGIGLAYASAASIIVESVPADRTGIATGVNANLRTIGSAIGSAFTTAVVFGSVAPGDEPGFDSYTLAWLTIAGAAVVAAVIVLAVRPRRVDAATARPLETADESPAFAEAA
ncbi:MFS transporter [Microbacterium kyungheense]|uniref:Putative MFS family arabinose efflux permease n=1 Tax=Microbacterium kyungheense TaxID=1263636 RepID=A0A543F1Y1_9MICO|nr:MFS transporter [Microbacterium kyungheense]TQM27819.1 putative MFS family arabinose efflux permease [Microbacterium kyungheense]